MRFETCTGVSLFAVELLPSRPFEPWPQVHTVPSDFRATEWLAPAVIAVTPVRPLTCTGRFLLLVLPTPHSPCTL